MARKGRKERVGEVLGLGDAPIAPDRHERVTGRAHTDEAARRRHRMSEGADELTPEPESPPRTSGATGIDMGAGGEGTDLE